MIGGTVSLLRAVAGAVVALAVVLVAIAAPAARVDAASEACTTTIGVTVIVDFTHFGGDLQRGCAPGRPSDALVALHRAGFTTAGTLQYGDAFVCRIDDRPSPRHEACTSTPPAAASWSFYTARASDSRWTYQSVGVLSYQPAPGTIEAFAFGRLAEPGIAPGAAIEAPTTTTTAGPAPTAAAIEPPTGPGALVTSPPPASPPVSATTSTPETAGAKRVTESSPTASGGSPTSTPRVVDRVATRAPARSSSGSPFPAMATVAAVVALSASSLLVVRRRRTSGARS